LALIRFGEEQEYGSRDVSSLGWEVGGAAWVWGRQLWAWEEETLGECQVLLHNSFFYAPSSDTWQWQLNPSNGYSVCDVYLLLTSHEFVPLAAVEDLIWHKQIPLKVYIFNNITMH
jgi:hypothetical protein